MSASSSSSSPGLMPEALREAFETLDRELHALPNARAMQQQGVRPELARQAARGLQRYLAGDGEQAAQIFEALAEELREQTMNIEPK